VVNESAIERAVEPGEIGRNGNWRKNWRKPTVVGLPRILPKTG
jgi:hypothetical protein